MSETLLRVENLTVQYSTLRGNFSVVDDVTFRLEKGQSLGILGESGCGKSTLAMSMLRLLPDNGKLTGGHIYFGDADLVSLPEDAMRSYRWNKISMVFQSAMNSLDPVYRVREQITEAIEAHRAITALEAHAKVDELFQMIGIDANYSDRYPHEFSGGMKQRAVLAMALACDPELLIADEPTTALDVIVQDRILRELRETRKRMGMSMIYISHDIGVIAEISDVVGVMYAGKLVEFGTTEDVYERPLHPYTKALLSAVPSVSGEMQEPIPLEGSPPDSMELPEGCRFHPRCSYATEICRRIEPRPEDRDGRQASCWHPLLK